MPFQVSPGINVSEIDLTTVVPNVATSIGAIGGGFQWGPVLERTRITTENSLREIFGKPNDDTAEYFLTAANYLAYSNNLLVVRNVGTSAKNAVVGDTDAGTAANVNNATDYDSDTFTDQLFVAKYPGALGNSLKAIVVDGVGWATLSAIALAARTVDQAAMIANFDRAPGTSTDVGNAGGSLDEMHVLVIDEDGLWTGTPGEVLEKHAFVSKASDAKRIDGSSNYIVNVLRNESKYIWLGLVTQLTATTVDSNTHAGQPKASTTFNRINGASQTLQMPGGSLTLGVDDNVLTDGELQAAYNLYVTPEVGDITLVMAGPASTVTGRWIVDNIASVRKDCVAFVSPAKASVVNAGTAQVANLTTDNTALGSSSYAVMDSAWKYQYDRYNDVFRYVPMNGDMAGLCARTDFTNDAWWSPAGMNRGLIKNIVKLSWEATKADRDTMYPISINPVITQRGTGVLLFGDKTMQTVPSAFDRINVRRLFIVLEKAISIAAKAMLFEFNDEFTRSQFVNMVTPFLREVQGRRGVTDFKVVCDSSNNTGQVIDTNNFVGDIYIIPARSINFIQLNFIAARTDVSFSEIGG
jgi:phage tail sheath protein FI